MLSDEFEDLMSSKIGSDHYKKYEPNTNEFDISIEPSQP